MRITKHLYFYPWNEQRENNCNSIFIDGKTPVLIDPGHLHRTPHLFKRMAEDGVKPERVKVVIGTHGHPDHIEAALGFTHDSVLVAVSREEERHIEEVIRPATAKLGTKTPDYRFDFYLQQGDLQLGKHEFQVIATPGHTPGSISLYWPRYKVLISGDVIFHNAIGRTDLPGGDAKVLTKTLAKLSALPAELVLPGHGPAIQGEDEVRSNFAMALRMHGYL